jgi:hypothetical protein
MMARHLKVAAALLGPIHKTDSVVVRLMAREAHGAIPLPPAPDGSIEPARAIR